MTPTEFTTQLELAVESRDHDALKSLQEIAADNAELHSIWEQHQRLEHAIDSWKASQPEVQLSEVVLEQLKPTVASSASGSTMARRQTSPRIVAIIGGSLAMLFLSFFVWNQFSFQTTTSESIATGDNEDGSRQTENTITKDETGNQVERVNLTGLFRDAGTSYKSLADDTMGSLADGAVLTASLQPTSNDWATSLPSIYSWPDEADKPTDDWSKSIEQAVDFLLSDESLSGTAL